MIQMIIIDMDMPNSCDECPLFDARWDYPTCYVNQFSSGYKFPVRDKRMDFCPIKCDIDDIRTEIEELNTYYHAPDALDKVLSIINKHIGKE